MGRSKNSVPTSPLNMSILKCRSAAPMPSHFEELLSSLDAQQARIEPAQVEAEPLLAAAAAAASW
jgi:hypothetical protein